MENLTVFTAFAAGVLSFISPCVLPLVPAYLSFISGKTVQEMRGEVAGVSRGVLWNSLLFIAGFSLVFICLGASASAIGQFIIGNHTLFSRVAGLIIVIFGLHFIGVLKISWLYRERRFQPQKKPTSFLGAVVIGMAFAFGWTPCIGPILAAILVLASKQDSVWQGMGLLAVYSAGLGLPFLLAGIGLDWFYRVFGKMSPRFGIVKVVSGLLLIIIGLMIATNNMMWFAARIPALSF